MQARAKQAATTEYGGHVARRAPAFAAAVAGRRDAAVVAGSGLAARAVVALLACAALTACEVAQSSSLTFACASDEGCDVGFACVDGRCVDGAAPVDGGGMRAGDGGSGALADSGVVDDAGALGDGGIARDGGAPLVDGGAPLVDGGASGDGGARVDGGAPLADGGAPIVDAGPGDAGAPDAGCTDTHDEDQDGVSDRCDNCPAVANPTQADVGEVGFAADGVGDACDPRPTGGGDAQLFFEPFAGAALPADWTIVGSGVSFAADRALLDVAGGAVSLVRDAPARVAVEITYRFLGPAGADEGLAVYLRAAANLEGGYLCAHYNESSPAGGATAIVEVDPGNKSIVGGTFLAAPDPALDVGGRLRFATFDGELTCARDGQSQVSGTDTSYSAGLLALSASDVRVEVLSATAWTLGGSP